METKNPKTDYQNEKIYVGLNELKKEINNLSKNMQKNFEVIMNKLMKIQEYNKISDMTNQVFEMRMANIEDLLLKMNRCK